MERRWLVLQVIMVLLHQQSCMQIDFTLPTFIRVKDSLFRFMLIINHLLLPITTHTYTLTPTPNPHTTPTPNQHTQQHTHTNEQRPLCLEERLPDQVGVLFSFQGRPPVNSALEGGNDMDHIVRHGETLQSIAHRYGVTVSSIMQDSD
jgi:hypothetical protein